ncbi:MAG: HAMP domain-containing sensor histidine kinase [Candidatus Hatepunaea meridiana]|nr:HAMP domain-containing sensor histidine kinase [Candidatus Hatepunaea meridiana]
MPDYILKNEERLVKRVEALEFEIGNEGVKNIIGKLEGIFLCIPNALVSLINTKFDLIAMSTAQILTFSPDNSIPRASKCYRFYSKLNERCPGCTGNESMMKGRTSFWPGAVTTDIQDPNVKREPNLIIFDSMSIPCGKKVGDGFSHCIKLVFNVSDREKERMEEHANLHKYTRIMFDRLQEGMPTHNLQCLLLFGCLYAPGERNFRAHLYILPEKYSLDCYCKRSLRIEKSNETNELWKEILDTKKAFQISSTIRRMAIHPVDEARTINDIGLSSKDLKILEHGKVCSFGQHRKAAGLVKGIPESELPSFLLVIDKEVYNQNDYIDFNEITAFSNYLTFCQHALLNRRWFIERTEMAKSFSRLSDLSKTPLRDAYVASLIISATHNAAHRWKSTFEIITDILIDKIPKSTQDTDEMRSIIDNYKASKEAIKNYFTRMDKWRSMNTILLSPIECAETINLVKKRYLARFKQINLSFDCEQKGIDKKLRVVADQVYFEEVIENLIQNAYDALSMASTINPRIQVTVKKDLNNMIKIVIQDNGPGFEKADKEIIWVPEYTTKATGTGQGLPFVKYSVEIAFRGKVECYSIPGKRTGFILYLNADEEK